jgi:hypothetical protein
VFDRPVGGKVGIGVSRAVSARVGSSIGTAIGSNAAVFAAAQPSGVAAATTGDN